MLDLVCTPAMQDVANELSLRGANVSFNLYPLEEEPRLNHLELVVDLGQEQHFIYQIWPQKILSTCIYLSCSSRKIPLLPARNLFMGRFTG